MLRRLPAMNRSLRLAVLFVLYLGVMHGVYQLERRTTDRFLERPLTHAVTVASAALGQLVLPFPVTRHGETLTSGSASVLVRAGCNGVEAMILILAGILAVPAGWSTRLLALAWNLPLLFVLNLLRVDALLYVLVRFPQHMPLAHDQIAQGIMVVVVLLLWLRYLQRLPQ